MKWFLFCLKRYATFKGRASRAEYWWFTLVAIIGNAACSLAMKVSPLVGTLITLVFSFGLVLPHLAVGVRRLHDVDQSGWWLAPVALAASILGATAGGLAAPRVIVGAAWVVALVLALVVLYFLLMPGDQGDNRYGVPAPTTPD